MKPISALVVSITALIFAVGGYFYRPMLVAGWVVFGVLAIIGLICEWE